MKRPRSKHRQTTQQTSASEPKLRNLNYYNLISVLRQHATQQALAQAMFEFLAIELFHRHKIIERMNTHLSKRYSNAKKDRFKMVLRNETLQSCLAAALNQRLKKNNINNQTKITNKITAELAKNIDINNAINDFIYLNLNLVMDYWSHMRDQYAPNVLFMLAKMALDGKKTTQYALKKFTLDPNEERILLGSILPLDTSMLDRRSTRVLLNHLKCRWVQQSSFNFWRFYLMYYSTVLIRMAISQIPMYFMLSFWSQVSTEIDSNPEQNVGVVKPLFAITFSLIGYAIQGTGFFKKAAILIGLTALATNWLFGKSLNLDFSFDSAFISSASMLTFMLFGAAQYSIQLRNINSHLTTEEAKGFLRMLMLLLNSNNLEKLFTSPPTKKPVHSSPPRSQQQDYTGFEQRTGSGNTRSQYPRQGHEPVENKEIKETADEKIEPPQVIHFNGVKYVTDPVHPNIARLQNDNDERLVRYALNPNIWFLQSRALLQHNCGLTQEQANAISLSRRYQDGAAAPNRFSSTGFVDMRRDSDDCDAFKFKMTANSTLSGKWPLFKSTDEKRNDGIIIYIPNGRYKHSRS